MIDPNGQNSSMDIWNVPISSVSTDRIYHRGANAHINLASLVSMMKLPEYKTRIRFGEFSMKGRRAEAEDGGMRTEEQFGVGDLGSYSSSKIESTFHLNNNLLRKTVKRA